MPDNEIKIDVDVDADPTAFDKLATQAKQGAAKAGNAIVDEIRQAGSKAEQEAAQAADAISRKLSDIPPPRFEDKIVRPARQAGEGAGSAIGDGIHDGLGGIDPNDLGGSMVDMLSGLGPAAAIVGAAVGEELAAGVSHGFSQDKNLILDGIRSDLDPSELAEIGEASGDAYAAGFGEGLRAMEENGQLIANTMEGIDDSLQMPEALKAAETLNELWGVDVPTSLRIARDLVTSGLAPDTITAYGQMADAQQRYRLDAEEINDVMEEFSSFAGRLGIEGSRAWQIVGDATRENIFPTVDRAGEMFEEFVITMQEGSTEARAAVEGIGLDFDEMQALFNSGRGDEALARISQALLDTDDKTQRNNASLAIFKAAMEGATDPERALQLYAQADAAAQLGTALEDGTAAIEGNQSALDRLKGGAEAGASAWAGYANDGLGLAIDAHDRFNGMVGDLIGRNDEATDSTNSLTDAIIAQANELQPGKVGRTAEEIAGLGDASDDAADSVADLDAVFSQLTGKFDGDQAIRGLHDQIRALTEGELELTGVTYDMGTGFDQTSASGGAMAAAMEDLHGGLVDVAEAHRNGTATTAELEAAQSSAESTVRAMARALGLNEDQANALVQEYAVLDGYDSFNVSANMTGNALDRANALFTKVRDLDGETATVTLTTRYNTIGSAAAFFGGRTRAAGGPVGAAAAGGLGAPTIVNDGGGMAGSESARLPSGDMVMLPFGSSVNSAEDTQRMHLDAANASGGPMVIELRSSGTAIDDVLLEVLRKAIKNQGGGVLKVLG